MNDDVEEFLLKLEHTGVRGMKWGVRRDPKTGVRPIAKTLDQSKIGKAANANAERSMARSNARRNLTPGQQRKERKKATLNRKTQSRINQTRKVARGKGSPSEKFVQAMVRVPVADLIIGRGVTGGSQRLLNRHLKVQAKILNGEAKARDVIAQAVGLHYRDLDFTYR